MNTQQTILKYCLTPRTVTELSEYCGLERQSIYTHLGKLQRAGKIEKRGDGQRRSNPAVFLTMRPPPTASENTEEYENLVITHAHNWFKI